MRCDWHILMAPQGAINQRSERHVMSHNLDFLWFCTLEHDGEFIGTKALPPRPPTLENIAHLIDTAGQHGFSGLLTDTRYRGYHETFTVSAAALARSSQAGLLISVRSGMFDAAIYAKMMATLANLFPGRVRLNVVTGSFPEEHMMYGDEARHGQRYERTREFLQVQRLLWEQPGPIDFHGKHFQYLGTQLEPKPSERIPLYLGGASEPAMRVAAELADVYLIWDEPINMVRARVQRLGSLSEEYGRSLRFGLRVHVVVRETEGEAVAAANRMISRVDPEARERLLRSYASLDSTGQTTQVRLLQHALERDDLFVEEHLWAGVGLASSGVGLAIVGNPAQVAAKIQQYIDIGISTFIFSGYPHLEECQRFAQLVMPYFQATLSPAPS